MKESGCVGTAVSGASGIRSRLACVMEKAVGVVGVGVVEMVVE